MKKLFIFLMLITGFSTLLQAKEIAFGTPIDHSVQVKISTILASPSEYLGKTVTVSGMIVGVCKKRGCWMKLASDAKFEKLRIKVKDGDMVFPMSAKGRTALATGRFTEIKLDIEHTKKYKAYQSKYKGEAFDPESVTKGMSIYQVVPVGVLILD
ncbi:MAG: DUF4920 domain-containing protein [Colwellia sp.]